jgi:hypothetical protein
VTDGTVRSMDAATGTALHIGIPANEEEIHG